MYFNLFKEDNNSKKKEKTPLNFEFENKNIDSLKKDDEIRILKKELKEKNVTINLINSKLLSLNSLYSTSMKLQKELKESLKKNEKQEQKIEELNQQLIKQYENFRKEKREETNKYLND